MPRENNPIRHQMKIYAPAALVVIAAFVLAFQFIKPAPPKHVVMATGGPEGAYHQFGRPERRDHKAFNGSELLFFYRYLLLHIFYFLAGSVDVLFALGQPVF